MGEIRRGSTGSGTYRDWNTHGVGHIRSGTHGKFKRESFTHTEWNKERTHRRDAHGVRGTTEL